jgi:hypothetical protein
MLNHPLVISSPMMVIIYPFVILADFKKVYLPPPSAPTNRSDDDASSSSGSNNGGERGVIRAGVAMTLPAGPQDLRRSIYANQWRASFFPGSDIVDRRMLSSPPWQVL